MLYITFKLCATAQNSIAQTHLLKLDDIQTFAPDILMTHIVWLHTTRYDALNHPDSYFHNVHHILFNSRV